MVLNHCRYCSTPPDLLPKIAWAKAQCGGHKFTMNLKRHWLLVALVALAVTASGCSTIQHLRARDHLNRGVKAYTAQQYAEAIENFESAVDLDPSLLDAYLYMAITYRAEFVPQSTGADNMELGRKAVETFEMILERAAPDDAQRRATAMANLAGIYSGMGDYDEAKSWYRRRLESEPDNPEPMYGIGTIDWQLSYDETGMNGEGVELLEDERKAQINGLVDEGIDALKQALEKNPRYTEAMQYLNLLYREKAKLAEDEEERGDWELQADRLALQALELKREQQREEEEARRTVTGGDD